MIRFQYQKTFKDYWKLNLYSFFARGTLLWLAVIPLMIGIAATTLGDSPGDSAGFMERYGPALIFPVIFIPVMTVVLYLIARKRWSGAEDLRAMIEYEMDEAGMRVKSALFQSSVEWRIFKFADFWQGYFFLRMGQRIYHIIPASAIPDRRAFLELISKNIKISRRWEIALQGTGS